MDLEVGPKLKQHKKKRVQVEWKWCGGLDKDNLKHKLHMAHDL
jgi:hypothetical protein